MPSWARTSASQEGRTTAVGAGSTPSGAENTTAGASSSSPAAGP